MSSKWSKLSILLPVALLGLAGGLFLSGQFSAESSDNPVDVLMYLERFYREKLAYEYASLEVSDRRVRDAVQDIYKFFETNRRVLGTLERRSVAVIARNFNSYVGEIVDDTLGFFNAEAGALELLEKEGRLVSLLEKLGLFDKAGKIVYTPMNQIRIGDYYKLLVNVHEELRNWPKIKEVVSSLHDDALLDQFDASLLNVMYFLREMYTGAAYFDIDCREFLGQRCTWMLHDFVDKNKSYLGIEDANISLPVFFNDMAALIHRYAEFVATLMPANRITIGHIRISYVEGSNTVLLNAVKTWANTVTLLEEHDWPYEWVDLRRLRADVYDDHAWVRVGSAAGHATHIVREGAEFTVMYYDVDSLVDDMFAKLVSEYVPKAKVNVFNGGVEVGVANEEDLIKMAKLLAFTTSLDRMLGNYAEEAVKNKIRDAIEKLHILS